MIALLLFSGCAQPLHLQYDHGRALMEAQKLQADITRPSVAESVYPLTGTEAVKLRQNVETASTEEKSGELEAVAE
jgi:hypothetical protein